MAARTGMEDPRTSEGSSMAPEAAEAYLQHFIILHLYAYRAKEVAKLLDLHGVACDGDVPLLDVARLLAELKLSCCCVSRENRSQIFPCFLRRLHECSQACGHGHTSPSNTSLDLRLPCYIFGSHWAGLIFLRSFNVAPITLSDKVLVHLVLPRCKVVSIQLLARESPFDYSLCHFHSLHLSRIRSM